MHPTAIDLFDDYRRDWEAALNPCLDCLLRSCPESEREALHALVENHLMTAATPPYSPVQMRRTREKVAPIVDRVMSEPWFVAEMDQNAAAWRDKPWFKKAWHRARFYATITRLRWRIRRRGKPWE